MSTIFTIVLVSAPSFLVGYLLLNFLAFQPKLLVHVEIFPIGGYKPLDLRYLALPAITLGFSGGGLLHAADPHGDARRAAPGLRPHGAGQGHRRTDRSCGATPFATRSARSSARSGSTSGFFLGGVVVVERIFCWPGIGKLAVDSIVTADVPLILGTVLFGTLCIVLANLFVDVARCVVDPRIRC